MRACRCRAKACHAEDNATRITLVVLQAAFVAKVRRPRAWSRRRCRLLAAPLWCLAAVA
jgi:hypothetical protein